MGWHRKRLSFQTAREDVALGAFEQAADRSSELEHLRRHVLVQPLFIEHRREQTDRHDDEGLVLRRPHRHRETVDMRAPGAAGDHIAVLLQMAAIVLDARLQDPDVIRNLPFHFRAT